MDTNTQQQIDNLLKDWHEAGRDYFKKHFTNLNYDTPSYIKRAIEKSKYICLDDGTSGAFILDKTTNIIYHIKSKYGVPNFKKPIGLLGTVTGADLNTKR